MMTQRKCCAAVSETLMRQCRRELSARAARCSGASCDATHILPRMHIHTCQPASARTHTSCAHQHARALSTIQGRPVSPGIVIFAVQFCRTQACSKLPLRYALHVRVSFSMCMHLHLPTFTSTASAPRTLASSTCERLRSRSRHWHCDVTAGCGERGRGRSRAEGSFERAELPEE